MFIFYFLILFYFTNFLFLVFHIGSSAKNPNLWRHVRTSVVGYFRQHPPQKAVSVPDFLMVPNSTLFETLFFLSYVIPINGFSIYANTFGTESQKKLSQKALRMKGKLFCFIYFYFLFFIFILFLFFIFILLLFYFYFIYFYFLELAYKISDEFSHFVLNEWIYSSKNADWLFSKLSPREQEVLDFNPSNIDWHSYIRANCWGLSTYVLKEKRDPHPNEERIVPIYFERRLHSIFTDIRWAYYTSPRVKNFLIFIIIYFFFRIIIFLFLIFSFIVTFIS